MTVFNKFGKTIAGAWVGGNCYIETGVGLGDTMANAIVPGTGGFEHCCGVDVSHRMAKHCRERFSGQGKVRIYEGHSPHILPSIMRRDQQTVFWLDAHYEPWQEDTIGPTGQCPLLEELHAIASVDWVVRPLIMIDDASIFCSPNEWWRTFASAAHLRSHWPTFGDIYDMLSGARHQWRFLIEDEVIYCY